VINLLEKIKKFYKESQSNEKYHPIVLHILSDIRPSIMIILGLIVLFGHSIVANYIITNVYYNLANVLSLFEYTIFSIISCLLFVSFMLSKYLKKYCKIWIYIIYIISDYFKGLIPIPEGVDISGDMGGVFSMLDEIEELDMSDIEQMSEFSDDL